MSKELFVSTTPHETKVGMVEDDLLAEIYYERENEYTLAGSIYKGRVTRVLPGMQSAFVELGLERDAFLYVTDFLEEQEDSEEFAADAQQQSGTQQQGGARKERPEGGRGRRGGGEREKNRPERPPAARAAAPAGSAAAEAEGEPAEEGGKGQGEFEEGTRRW